MEYSLSKNCTKNYCNRTIIAKIIVGGWVVYLQHSGITFVLFHHSQVTVIHKNYHIQAVTHK